MSQIMMCKFVIKLYIVYTGEEEQKLEKMMCRFVSKLYIVQTGEEEQKLKKNGKK